MDYIKIGNLKFSRGVLFILPGILFFGIMVIYPAGYVIYLSLFTEGKGPALRYVPRCVHGSGRHPGIPLRKSLPMAVPAIPLR